MLGMERINCPQWHRDRLREELEEVRTAPTPILRLSETSDVFFSIRRACYDGHPTQELPPCSSFTNIGVYAYMIGKFTLRWGFYRMASCLCRAPNWRSVGEVVNPGKDAKIRGVAARHNLDQDKFLRVARRLRRMTSSLPVSGSDHPIASETVAPNAMGKAAKVIGTYGIPGTGKTFLLNQLKAELNGEHFLFIEGSELIDSLVPGGLQGFKDSDGDTKTHWRRRATETIKQRSVDSGKVAIVTGHLAFWTEDKDDYEVVFTDTDGSTYTHIIYLDFDPELIEHHRTGDTTRNRPKSSSDHLAEWQIREISDLQTLCREHGILFHCLDTSGLQDSPHVLPNVCRLVEDFRVHDVQHNHSRVLSVLDNIFVPQQGTLKTVLVFDADKTLAAEDTGTLYWDSLQNMRKSLRDERRVGGTSTLPLLFGGPLGYSYEAFRQAVLLYEESAGDSSFESLCQLLASNVKMHPEVLDMLQAAARQDHIGTVVVSCGIGRVWEIVLERRGLGDNVKVIAGGRIADGYVVTPANKAAIVSHLRNHHQLFVWAFGDSPLDIGMMKAAHRAVVVVGEKDLRSKSMDMVLMKAIDEEGLQAVQVRLPRTALHRLNTTRLPIVTLDELDFKDSHLHLQSLPASTLPIWLATSKRAAQLLATATRDASIAGPALRQAHQRVGWYLATEYISQVIGLKECDIQHVLGSASSGHRLQYEKETTIIALMRAGEPMALGVSEAFPLAMFVQAECQDNIRHHHLESQKQVLLVDSVINSGKTIVEFVEAIRKVKADIKIVIVSGVVQAQCLQSDSNLYKALVGHRNISLVALRHSDTKFTGSGATDTGNRLFNTTHIRRLSASLV
ncbi:hypothetical protein BU24DRAFT_486265 [Aaosphaeria arxii CBS 175.79]|uniref:Phosphoribosyltransferase domain-containing protein n=1 Tax=Aaosphaeria arxii CBS 175.79 TaxID=1450172 RepID=A0A6A5XGR5_9PLEO|nr:uncharacterized protein BU24DRAFT_486265 [Aaosphaeria arxii CBS 175.79]KAF2011554.1 hypothetical protein BU24DRAFT_486265 [Aaosphaeria arxii CBS 175.79]